MDMQFCAQPNFNSAFSFSHGQGQSMEYQEGQYPVYQTYHGLQYMYPPQQPRDQLMHDRSSMSDGKTESKPRLSKEEVEKLEKVFQENPKPSSSVKAQLADGLGLERPRINNWFQNRRAKAKQERKQEEYEARRAAEKEGSESDSLEESSSEAPDFLDEDHQRTKPSSALYPDMSSASISTEALYDEDDLEEDEAIDSKDFDSDFAAAQSTTSPQDDTSTDFQSPLSLNFPQPDHSGFAYSLASQEFSHQPVHVYNSFDAAHQSPAEHLDQSAFPAIVANSVSSPEEQVASADYHADHYLKVVGTGYPSSALPFYHNTPTQSEHKSLDVYEQEVESHDSGIEESIETDGSIHSVSQGGLTPADSFKSPPPPSNIAVRRNIQRPAAIQTSSIRSRSYNLGPGPKTSLDSPRRTDPTSPATAMRRIASANGTIAGRIQKQVAGPRSPMFMNRNTEAFLQYHSRSPVGTISSALGSTAPPTPMTPMVMSQHGSHEPSVTSNCSDDEAFMLGTSLSGNFMHDLKTPSLKTPPGTPGLMNHFALNSFNSHPFGGPADYNSDRPLLTPYFQTEFPDLSLTHVPHYVDLSDTSLPSTPLYPNMASSAQDGAAYTGTTLGNTREYDWDANESVTSSKSSPGQPRSRQIQFTQNMTPQDYNLAP